MEAVLALALLTGLDNLRFGIGLGTLDIPTEQRFRLAAAFGLFEAGTPIIGIIIGSTLAAQMASWVGWLGPAFILAAGAMVLLGVAAQADLNRRLARSRWLLVVPLLLSVDNLFAGGAVAELNVAVVPALLVVGLGSAALGFAGLVGGAIVAKHTPANKSATAGFALIFTALVSFIVL